jgi:hypothetical protein
MAALTGITLIKSMPYRDNPDEEWSNKYHFNGPPPNTSAEWKALADGLIGHEKSCYDAQTKVVRAYGYNTDDVKPISVWTYDYLAAGEAVTGTLTSPSGVFVAGDQAAVMHWTLDVKDIKGRYIRCRKYFHSGFVISASPNLIADEWGAAMNTFATALRADGGAYWGGIRSRTHTAPIIQAGASSYITTRTLRRRGKRKHPPA